MRTRPALAALLGAALILAILLVAANLRPGGTDQAPGGTDGAGASEATAASSVQPTASGAAGSASPSVPPSGHVWLVVFENRSYGRVIGNPAAPYLTSLAARYGVATDYHAVARPSQPNYLALLAGSTLGVTDNGAHTLAAPTILDQLDATGRSWRVFAENVPGGCFTGATASGGADGPGTYARKHEPAISFRAVSASAERCARITNLASFDPAAADFSLIVPNMCHSMHDCSTREGDAWLAAFAPRIIGSAAFRDGGLLLITFDEADGGDATQHVALVAAGPTIAPGTRLPERATHYALLRTLQERWGLGCLADSCTAAPLPELLGGG